MASPASFRHGWIFAAMWLFYLTGTVRALLDHPGGGWRDTGLVAITLFVIVYVLLTGSLREIRQGRAAASRIGLPVRLGLVIMLGLALLQVPAAGSHALPCAVYIAATAMIGLPQREGLAVVATLAVAVESTVRLVPGWQDGDGAALAVVLAGAATWGLRTAVDRQNRLQDATREIAVAGERTRIAADLHDILGHSLTVVAVKAELAQRLLDVDLDRARTELAGLEALARDALADVRATALGVRGVSLPGEIAAARAALAAADVAADLPGSADDVPTRNRELFAWTIREAVTNIVRHSRARHATIHLTPASVEIVDDGTALPPIRPTADGVVPGPGLSAFDSVVPGPAQSASDGVVLGQGLSGLHRRADEVGARLTVGRRHGKPGFAVRMEVP
ncbi:sensor histidine kinase [Actinoplanes derwentensis]|uniref:Two-component system, NarL family, sensor histidine kinase DesK n=1 Tax=Actinoplanes derwentensis TaxID=113562 RepID=A0A1H2AS07_9ACTN|nr:histidine kinase [Actinoplanes derwentensis]GID84349.1 histidine kinase [Actinoplanes derwentensis]SDT48825.1 two-component system, NarL family, sensor histidine kinase DesK [Actinoplanes derwentensis]